MEQAGKHFLAHLERVMEQEKVTTAQLAEKAGVGRQSLYRVLAGEEGLTIDRAERIATALGKNLWEMLEPPGKQPKKKTSKQP